MTNAGSMYATHGPTNIPVLRDGPGPGKSCDPSSSPIRQTSTSPMRGRNHTPPSAPYPPVENTPNGRDGGMHQELIE
eukprot:704114-Lingulodinium_polyedra.AAC.1